MYVPLLASPCLSRRSNARGSSGPRRHSRLDMTTIVTLACRLRTQSKVLIMPSFVIYEIRRETNWVYIVGETGGKALPSHTAPS